MPEPSTPENCTKPISQSTRIPEQNSGRAAERTLLILTAAAAGMACLLALLPAAGHDQMWLLYAAGRMLRGAPLYGPRIFETNPPLILWLSAVPAGLSRLTHLPDTALGKFFVLACEVAIGLICLPLVRRVHPHLGRAGQYWLAFAYITIFAVIPARDFGQRDHLLILFVLPYVFAAGALASGRPITGWPAWIIGALAIAGLVLKPHQVLIPIAVETALLVRRRLRGHNGRNLPFLRPEIYALVLGGLLFLAAIARFAPLYFSLVLPLVRDTYWAYHQLRPEQLAAAAPQLHVLAAVDIAILLWIGYRNVSGLVWILLVAGFASGTAYYIQGTGWYYQQLPALSLLALALAFLLLALVEPPAKLHLACPRWLPAAALGLGTLALVLTAHFMNYPFTPSRSFPVDVPDPVFFSGLAPGTAVLTISPTIDYTIQPVYKYHLRLGQRYPALLMLPALLRSEDPQGGPVTRHLSPPRLAELDALQHRFMVEDLRRWDPQLLLVQRCQDPAVHCQVLEDRHDNLLAWFLRDPAFRTEFARYRYWRSAGEFDGYVLRSVP